MAVLFPEPAGHVRNMINWFCPPFASNLWTMSLILRVAMPPMVCPRHEYKVLFGSFPSWTKPRRNVQAIISYAIYCFSSSFLFLKSGTFFSCFTEGWYFVCIWILVFSWVIWCDYSMLQKVYKLMEPLVPQASSHVWYWFLLFGCKKQFFPSASIWSKFILTWLLWKGIYICKRKIISEVI